MAQLSDDCFAFGGPMMSVDEAVAIHRRASNGGARYRDRTLSRCRWAHSPQVAFLRRCRCRHSPILRSMAMPCVATMFRVERKWHSGDRPRSGRRAKRATPSNRATRCGFLPARGSRMVRYGVHARGRAPRCARQGCSPGGPQAGRQCAPRRRRRSWRHFGSGRRSALAAADVALAAAFGLTQVDVCRRIRVAVFSTGNDWCRRAARVRLHNCSIPTAYADGDAEAAWLRGEAISASSATIAPRSQTA